MNIADEQRVEIASSLSRGIEEDTPKKSPEPKRGKPEETDTYIAKLDISKLDVSNKQEDNKDMYIKFLEERMNKLEQRLNGTIDYIQ